MDRISAIESLGRTRELTIKDLWVSILLSLAQGKTDMIEQDGGKYRVTTRNAKGAIEKLINFEVEEKEEDKDDKDD